jgi:hypothetical protein
MAIDKSTPARTMITRFTSLLLAAAILALSACGGGGGGGGGDIIPRAHAQTSTTPIVGNLHFILRPDANGNWVIQNDAGHKSIGVYNVVQYPTHLRVNFTHTWKYAGTIQLTMDDDFNQKISAHANLGLTAAEIRIYANGVAIDPSAIWTYVNGPNGNIWGNVTMVD